MVIIYTVSTICTVLTVCIVPTVCTVRITKCAVYCELIIKCTVCRSLLQTYCEICGLLQFASERRKFVAKCAVCTNR